MYLMRRSGGRLWWATPGYESVHYPAVVHHFAVAVEIELRERVFRPFVKEIKNSNDILQSVQQGKGKRAERWHRWLKSIDFKGTLAEMFEELDPSKKCGLLPWPRLQDWLTSEYPNLRHRFGLLRTNRLIDLRNSAIHRTHLEAKEDALEACRLCQALLTAMHSKL